MKTILTLIKNTLINKSNLKGSNVCEERENDAEFRINILEMN